MSLRLLEPGLMTLVVDAGRPSTRSLGVPLGGPADRASFALANALAGNPPDTAGLEVCLAGPVLRADADLGLSLVGAPFDVFLGERRIVAGRSFNIRQGEVLRISGTAVGARAYLGVTGGLRLPEILGSRSSLEPLRRGIELPAGPSRCPARAFEVPSALTTWSSDIVALRALPGPQADWFALTQFFGPTFRVTPTSNRMGLRLIGAALTRPQRELVSEPVAPGAVQVVNDGQCIVLGVDGQTIGGYPKVAQVIDADLDRLGQLRPGQEVRFQQVDVERAIKARIAQARVLNEWVLRLSLSTRNDESTP